MKIADLEPDGRTLVSKSCTVHDHLEWIISYRSICPLLQRVWRIITSSLILILGAADIHAQTQLGPDWQAGQPLQSPATVPMGVQAAPSYSMQSNGSGTPATLINTGNATTITPDIQELATGLNNDPVRIFNYVRNQIVFQPYYGSNKGAEVTYLDGAGNDMDQASLLIALLNAAGYSNTMYVYGTLTMPENSLTNDLDLAHWVGSPYMSTYVMSSGNIPLDYWVGMGGMVYWTFDHVWVRATINGTTYDLDPSIKMSISAPIIGVNFSVDGGNYSGYNRSQLLSDAGGAGNQNYVQGMNRAKIEADLGSWAMNLRNFLAGNYPNAGISQIIGGYHIQQQNITTLSQGGAPAGLTLAASFTFTSIPSNLIATINIQTPTATFNATLDADSLQGAPLDFYLQGLASPNPGNFQLYLQGNLIAQFTGTGFVSSMPINISVTEPTASTGVTQLLRTESYLAGYTYDISYSFYPNPQSNGQIAASLRQEQQYSSANQTQLALYETLHALGLEWDRRVALVTAMMGQIRGDFSEVNHIVGRTGQEKSYYVDMSGMLLTFLSGPDPTTIDYTGFNAAMFLSSAMEDGVIEQNGDSPAVSTVRCLTMANDLDQPIYLTNQSNYASVEPMLTGYSTGQTGTFTSLINNGATLLLSKNAPLTENKWSGFGYAYFTGGTTGMIISGGYSGGYLTTEQVINGSQYADNYYFTPPPSTTTPDNVLTTVSDEPVDLLSGAYTMEHTDLSLGLNNSPRGLNFTRYYDSSRNYQSSMLGYGWRNSCEGVVTVSSDLDAAFGLTQPWDAAQTLVGMWAVADLSSAPSSPQELLVAALCANWTVNRITNNDATVRLGNHVSDYTSQPDGTWNPPPGGTSTLSGASGSFVLSPRFGGSVTFNSANQISQWKDADNNTETFSYTSGTLSTVTDQYGRTLNFTYSNSGVGAGLLQNVTDSTGRKVQFTYTQGTPDSGGGANLNTVTDADNYEYTLLYDGSNHLTDWLDNSGVSITHNNYDGLGRVYQQVSQGLSSHTWQFLYSPGSTLEVDPQGDITTHLFDSQNRDAGTINALGNASSISYDSQNHVIQTVDPTGRQSTALYDDRLEEMIWSSVSGTDNNGVLSTATTNYYYDAYFRLQYVYDPTGRYTQYGYDAYNHLTDIWDPGRRHTQYFYKPTGGLLDHITDGAGNTTSFTSYDAYGNCAGMTRGDGSMVSSIFDALGDPTSYTDGRHYTTNYTYYNRRLPHTATDPYTNATTWVYDSNAYLYSVTDRNGNVVTTPHNNLGHLESTTETSTGTINYGYNTCDWLTSGTDGLGHTTDTNYDAAGRATSVLNGLQIVTASTSYDAAGRVSEQYDGLFNGTQSFYDGVGRLETLTDPLTHSYNYTYDAAGRMLSLQNRRSKTFSFGYATDGLQSSGTYPTGRSFQILNRDADTRPQLLISPSGNQTTLTYDGLGRTGTSADAVGTICWTRDAEGNATDVTETSSTSSEIGGDTHRVFDEIDRVTSCTDVQGNSVGYGYDKEHNITSITYPGNWTVHYTYDGSNRVKTVTDGDGRLTTYNYDNAGRLQSLVLPNGSSQPGYDNANRLTSSLEKTQTGETSNTIWQASYTYYNNNALWTYTPTPMDESLAPPSTAMGYDDDNRINTYNGQAVADDLDGNMLSAPVNGTVLGTLTWDKRNRLTNAGGVSYTYDAENRRLTSTVNGQTTTYMFSRVGKLDQLLVKIDPYNNVTRYVYGRGLLYEVTRNSVGLDVTPIYYHFDWRGDTVALTNASGGVLARMSYDPYGNQTVVTGTVTTPFCFNGKWGVITDQNGLLCMQARFYSPVVKRFLNEDPSGFSGGTDMYAYADGDPLDLLDPFGLGPVTSGGSGYDVNSPSSDASVEGALVSNAGKDLGAYVGGVGDVANFAGEAAMAMGPIGGEIGPEIEGVGEGIQDIATSLSDSSAGDAEGAQYVYHGTTTAETVTTDGLSIEGRDAFGEINDQRGFSTTTDPDIAQAWANFKASPEGGATGDPVVLRANISDLPSPRNVPGEFLDPSEYRIDVRDYPLVGPGIFQRMPP